MKPPRPLKISCHTGTCLLSWACTVGNEPGIARQTKGASPHLDSVWNETDGPPRLQVNPLVRAFRSSIQQDDLGSLLLELAHLVKCDAKGRYLVLLIRRRRAAFL